MIKGAGKVPLTNGNYLKWTEKSPTNEKSCSVILKRAERTVK